MSILILQRLFFHLLVLAIVQTTMPRKECIVVCTNPMKKVNYTIVEFPCIFTLKNTKYWQLNYCDKLLQELYCSHNKETGNSNFWVQIHKHYANKSIWTNIKFHGCKIYLSFCQLTSGLLKKKSIILDQCSIMLFEYHLYEQINKLILV